MKTRILLAVLIACSTASVYAQQTSIFRQTITIKPSAPTAYWQADLPPLATAVLTVVVEASGTVGTTPYVLKSGPTVAITGSAGNGVLWVQTASAPFKFKVVNTATVEHASTTVTVACVWGPQQSGGGGGGSGTPPPDINGLAKGLANLPETGSCAWSFDRVAQFADGLSTLPWRLRFVNVNGLPKRMTFSTIEAENVAPAATWTINPNINARTPVTGTLKSVTASKANLMATYTENGVNRICHATTTLYFVNVELTNPTGDPVAAPAEDKNEFTFDTGSPGKLKIDFKAKVTPDEIPAADGIKDLVKFMVDAIGASVLKWDLANPSGAASVDGTTLVAKAIFEGLPNDNSHFGKKKAAMRRSTGVKDETTIEVFFDRDAKNHPGGQAGSPNWYHYWSQVLGAGYDLKYGGAGTGAGAEVKGMTEWKYTVAPNKTRITVYDPAAGKGKSYGVGKLFSGIDRFFGTVFHEGKHVDQIARADALVPSHGNDSFRYGWAWNQPTHNHWKEGPDMEWGVAGFDDDGNGITDDAAPTPPFEPGNGDDETLDHAIWFWWPKAWPLPSPNNAPHPVESEAVNFSDANHDENKRARDDWGNPGKNHKTLDTYND